ncbi:MAG: flagellar export chaperone FliS [Candidatus Gastranaerophilales bacterium]|nr:flagellar export chaperone FliS [Candidatus Gastranaerophilales bacterium]
MRIGMSAYNPNSAAHLKQYQQTQIQTATPEKLLIMLYNGAINFLNKAKVYIEQKDYAQTNTFLLKAQAIISEFMNTIDWDPNPEFAQNLYSLYDFMNNTLIQANINKDSEKIDVVIDLLKTLKSAWEEAAIKVAKERELQSQEEGSIDNYERIDITDGI